MGSSAARPTGECLKATVSFLHFYDEGAISSTWHNAGRHSRQ